MVFADFGYGLITAGLLDRILPACARKVPVLSADVSGKRSNLLRFRSVDLLCPTEREVREAQHDFAGGLGAVVWNLLDATDAARAIVTLGKQGLVTFERAGRDDAAAPVPAEPGAVRASAPSAASDQPADRLRSEYLPALSDRAVDPLGCGDALLAAATLALAAGGLAPGRRADRLGRRGRRGRAGRQRAGHGRRSHRPGVPGRAAGGVDRFQRGSAAERRGVTGGRGGLL